MKLYTYTVALDYGFAPNPFHGVCTLATCKPKIRAAADVGDWVVGTGARTKYRLDGRLVYAMQVDEALTFDQYWRDPRFACKRPVLNGSLKQVYGDNIYRRARSGWIQADSHHSREGGGENARNLERDTSADRVLIGRRFVYYGGSALLIPAAFRPYSPTGEDLCWNRRSHRVLSPAAARAFELWLESEGAWGLRGMPAEYAKHRRSRPVS